MLAQSHARKPAPPLAARGMWLRLGVGADAFGSALGDAVVGSIQRADSQKARAISEGGDNSLDGANVRTGKPADMSKIKLPAIDPDMPFGPPEDPNVWQKLADLDQTLHPKWDTEDFYLLAEADGAKRSTSGEIRRIFGLKHRDDPALRAQINQAIQDAQESLANHTVQRMAKEVRNIEVEGLDNPTNKDPNKPGVATKGSVGIDVKWDQSSAQEHKFFRGDTDGNLVVGRTKLEGAGKISLNQDGLDASVRVGGSVDMQYARDQYTIGVDKAEVTVRTAADFAGEGKANLGSRSGEISAQLKAEAVALQAVGMVEQSFGTPGGADVKAKGSIALNAGAIGGSGKIYAEYNSGTFKAGMGASANALFGVGISGAIEVNMNKFSFTQLNKDVDTMTKKWANGW